MPPRYGSNALAFLRLTIGRVVRGLYQHADGKLTGDFTPHTCQIPREQVFRIAREWPDMKVMLTLRDPVDWMVFVAQMWLFDEVAPDAVSEEDMLAFARTFPYPGVDVLSAWEEAFAGRFQLLFFDDFLADPERFLLQSAASSVFRPSRSRT